jgi:hypothetical protein
VLAAAAAASLLFVEEEAGSSVLPLIFQSRRLFVVC